MFEIFSNLKKGISQYIPKIEIFSHDEKSSKNLEENFNEVTEMEKIIFDYASNNEFKILNESPYYLHTSSHMLHF